MQPQIVNALGGPSNVSSPVAVNAERSERMLPSVSMSNLVRYIIQQSMSVFFVLSQDSRTNTCTKKINK